ncbi:MAG TPA: S8 family serine peptidase [Rugosimonospora sp.]
MARRFRRLAAAAAAFVVAGALALPATAAHAAPGGYTPSSREWWMSNWSVPQKVWPVTEGAGVTVAVLDGGVQASIPDLRGVVESGADMLGDPGNGEQDYVPDGGHGTAVATLIAGQGIGVGPVGIAPRAKILPVHVIVPSTDMTPVANGIRYAVDHGAQIINMSLGATVPTATTCDPAEQQAVAYALAHNVVVVAASGDVNKSGTSPEEPGTCAGVLTVGGVEPNGSLWQYSTQGPQVSVAAPSDHMFTVNSNGRQYTVGSSGTSLSAPLVSGAAALIRSEYPSMPWYTVVQRLIDTAIPQGSVPNNQFGYGILDVSRAVNASAYPVTASAPNPVYARYQAWLKTPAGQQFAAQNGISTGPSTGTGAQAGPSAMAKPSSGGSGTLTFVLIAVLVVVVLVVVIGGGLAFFLISRNRTRRGPRHPGGPGGGYGPPSGYGPPPGQYPQQGQYPPPGQYPPYQPAQQYPPPRQ